MRCWGSGMPVSENDRPTRNIYDRRIRVEQNLQNQGRADTTQGRIRGAKKLLPSFKLWNCSEPINRVNSSLQKIPGDSERV